MLLTYILFQTFLKYIFLWKAQPLLEVLHYAGTIYKENSKPHQRNYELCSQYAKLTQNILRASVGAYVLITTTVSIPTAIFYYSTGEKASILHLYYIGIKEYSNALMGLLNVHNLGIVIMANLCVMPPDALTFMTFANMSLISRIVAGVIKDFEENLQSGTFTTKEIKVQMVKMIQMNEHYVQ